MEEPRSHRIIWSRDPQTVAMAIRHPLRILSTEPRPQFAGYNFNTINWNHRVTSPVAWPPGPLTSSPDQIISLFQQHNFLEALAMVVSWGKMWRTPDAIYGYRSLPQIKNALESCALSIQRTQSIATSWIILTGTDGDHLGWSPVMSSKTLHFLCRALGFIENPPVAIDNAIILRRVWPAFAGNIPPNERPGSWEGNSLAAYSRYMSAILVWAEQRRWTTTEIETTIFDEYAN